MSGMFWSLSAPSGLITDVTRPSFRMSVTENLRKCRVNEKNGTKTSENVAFSCIMAGTIQHRICLLPKVSDLLLITVIMCPPSNPPSPSPSKRKSPPTAKLGSDKYWLII